MSQEPLKAFGSLNEFLYQLNSLHDERLYPMVLAIRKLSDAYAKTEGTLGLLLEMRRTGLIGDSSRLTMLGRELWNHFHA